MPDLNIKSQNHGVDYFWSNHALERWQQRFAGINMDIEFASSARVGRKTKKRIRELTPLNAEKYMQGFAGRYYLLGRSNVVFVIASDFIVTVFHIYGDGSNE
jgi:hypothetical protein